MTSGFGTSCQVTTPPDEVATGPLGSFATLLALLAISGAPARTARKVATAISRRRTVGSTLDDRLGKQQHLLLVRRLKSCCPLFKVSPCHRCGSPLARYIATLSSLDQLLQGHLEVVQLDSRSQRSR